MDEPVEAIAQGGVEMGVQDRQMPGAVDQRTRCQMTGWLIFAYETRLIHPT
ncbi:hypothetical protein [Actinokineospora diospyrosa]|uniref:Uncharacterized protein n=1 Tax=Actinokineospora diospyrosa TaxID=103728 RepID=A0ABT1IKE7_9PSEU|nr:hypothetical protein [Actinokineospora diospyrosa]MCP2272686.1 hypothetical protein [Actinokineospora diospyrosa]